MKSSVVSVALAAGVGFMVFAPASASPMGINKDEDRLPPESRQIHNDIDDQDFTKISYAGQWKYLSEQGSLDYQGTVSLSYDPTA